MQRITNDKGDLVEVLLFDSHGQAILLVVEGLQGYVFREFQRPLPAGECPSPS